MVQELGHDIIIRHDMIQHNARYGAARRRKAQNMASPEWTLQYGGSPQSITKPECNSRRRKNLTTTWSRDRFKPKEPTAINTTAPTRAGQRLPRTLLADIIVFLTRYPHFVPLQIQGFRLLLGPRDAEGLIGDGHTGNRRMALNKNVSHGRSFSHCTSAPIPTSCY